MHNGMYSTPCATVNADKGTITTAAVPEITPARLPINGAVIPMMTEDQMPRIGLIPTMDEQAIALERSEKATVRPARASWIMLGEEVVVAMADDSLPLPFIRSAKLFLSSHDVMQ